MRRYIILIPTLMFLTGCLSPQEIEMEKRQHCASIGAPEGSKNYYDCRKDIEYRLLIRQKMMQDAFKNVPPPYVHQHQPIQYQPPVMRQPMNCRTYQMGNQINTDCN